MKKIFTILLIVALCTALFSMTEQTKKNLYTAGKLMYGIGLPATISIGGAAVGFSLMTGIGWWLSTNGVWTFGLFTAFRGLTIFAWTLFPFALATTIVGFIFKNKYKESALKESALIGKPKVKEQTAYHAKLYGKKYQREYNGFDFYYQF